MSHLDLGLETTLSLPLSRDNDGTLVVDTLLRQAYVLLPLSRVDDD